jgi:hypothetical protein
MPDGLKSRVQRSAELAEAAESLEGVNVLNDEVERTKLVDTRESFADRAH